MISKEENIRKTLDSINTIERAEADPLLLDKIIQRIDIAKNRTISIQPRLLLQLAACIAVLIAFNIITWIHFSKNKKNSVQTNYSESIQSVAENYFN